MSSFLSDGTVSTKTKELGGGVRCVAQCLRAEVERNQDALRTPRAVGIPSPAPSSDPSRAATRFRREMARPGCECLRRFDVPRIAYHCDEERQRPWK